MLEHALAELFEEQASENPPPVRASVARAAAEGRRQRRRRQASVLATPVFAAGAVLAIAFFVIAAGPGGHQPAAGGAPKMAPGHFSPLQPYVQYGWLPDGQSTEAKGAFGRTEEILYGGDLSDTVSIHSAGACDLKRGDLTCGGQVPEGKLGRLAGQVDGHPAYWTQYGPALAPIPHPTLSSTPTPTETPTTSSKLILTSFGSPVGGTLIWQYARGAWAQLSAKDEHVGLRIARNLIFGPAAGPPIRFSFQLTDVPASWQVNSVATGWQDGVQYASSYVITAGAVDSVPLGVYPSTTPLFDAGPAMGKQSSCKGLMYYKYRTETINGYQVYVDSRPRAGWPESELCTASADGQMAWLAMGRHPTISAVDLFAHHMRLLGPDLANWTTRPIG